MYRSVVLRWTVLSCLVCFCYADAITLPYAQTCESAKMWYWQKNPDVAQAPVDAVRHYQISGYNEQPGRGNWTTTYGTLCSRLNDYVNQSVCQCSQAISRYIAVNAAASSYPSGAWAHYTANAPGNSAIWWPCELCFVNSTCDCWQSRQNYAAINPDIGKTDALFFYSAFGRKNTTRPALNCNLCNTNPIQMSSTSSLCNCINAQNDYKARYASILSATYAANPFSHYIAYSRMMGTFWDCSLCDTNTSTPADPILAYLTTAQTCLGARLAYLAENNDVVLAAVDPVHHYQYSGHAEGRQWRIQQCNATYTGVTNVFMTSAVAQCDAANNDYANRYKDVAPANAWKNYYRNILTLGRVYSAQLCSGAVQRTVEQLTYLTHECTCMAARELYWAKNPDVANANLDPVVHYETQHDRAWDCSPCNATSLFFINDVWSTGCAAAVKAYTNTPHNETSTYVDPFAAWWNNRYLLKTPWRSDSCYTPLAAKILPSFKPMDNAYSWSFHSAAALTGWTSASWATIVSGGYKGNKALNITVPVPVAGQRPETRLIEYDGLNMTILAGAKIWVTCTIKTIGVSVPLASYNGIKLVFYMKGKQSGEETWNNAYLVGTNDWNSTNYQYIFTAYNDSYLGSFSIGLQDSSGTILVDTVNITVFRVPPPPLPTPQPNPPPKYTGHDYVPRFRGVMSPVNYVDSDIQNVGVNWRANLIRWQLNWDTASNDDRNNLVKYDQWLTAKLNETDYMLKACVKYGMKAVIDLHTVPGGQDASRGQYFLLMQTYQQKFISVWQTIATRYKGNQAVWGYDLANEPLQWLPGDPGVMQWQQLVEYTTSVIRAIDSQVTIIIESEYGGSQDGFNWLRPVNDDKVVYSMHMYAPQGFTFQGAPDSGFPIYYAQYPGYVGGVWTDINTLRYFLSPVRAFQLAFNVQIYIGEFSAVRWALNSTAINYIKDCITIFEDYGWDYTYHAYREYQGFSVELDENPNDLTPVTYNTTRKIALLSAYSNNYRPYSPFQHV